MTRTSASSRSGRPRSGSRCSRTARDARYQRRHARRADGRRADRVATRRTKRVSAAAGPLDVAERTLILVKPDAFDRGLTGEIIARFERKGLKLAAMKLMRVDRELA